MLRRHDRQCYRGIRHPSKVCDFKLGRNFVGWDVVQCFRQTIFVAIASLCTHSAFSQLQPGQQFFMLNVVLLAEQSFDDEPRCDLRRHARHPRAHNAKITIRQWKCHLQLTCNCVVAARRVPQANAVEISQRLCVCCLPQFQRWQRTNFSLNPTINTQSKRVILREKWQQRENRKKQQNKNKIKLEIKIKIIFLAKYYYHTLLFVNCNQFRLQSLDILRRSFASRRLF